MDDQKIQDAVRLAKENDQRAFVFLYDTYWTYLFGYLRKKINNPLLAEELALKTLARAFDKIDTYNPEYAFKTWLVSISKNLQIDQARSDQIKENIHLTSIEKNQLSNVADENPSPEDQLIRNQNLNELLSKIKQLQTVYATVLRLRFFEEMSYKEIAETTQTPLNTVKVTLLRAKKLLAQKINES